MSNSEIIYALEMALLQLFVATVTKQPDGSPAMNNALAVARAALSTYRGYNRNPSTSELVVVDLIKELDQSDG